MLELYNPSQPLSSERTGRGAFSWEVRGAPCSMSKPTQLLVGVGAGVGVGVRVRAGLAQAILLDEQAHAAPAVHVVREVRVVSMTIWRLYSVLSASGW